MLPVEALCDGETDADDGRSFAKVTTELTMRTAPTTVAAKREGHFVAKFLRRIGQIRCNLDDFMTSSLARIEPTTPLRCGADSG
jgi:hypothetical protein